MSSPDDESFVDRLDAVENRRDRRVTLLWVVVLAIFAFTCGLAALLAVIEYLGRLS